MKEVLRLVVLPDGSFSWQFAPDVDVSVLPTYTLAAAATQLQTMVQQILNQGTRRQPAPPDIALCDESVLNNLLKRNGQ